MNKPPKVVRDLIALTQPERESALRALLSYSKEEKPNGKTDNANRWLPDNQEKQTCCSGLRYPSRQYPWSLYKHCFALEHKEHLFGAKHDDVLIVKRWLAANDIDPTQCDLSATQQILANVEKAILESASLTSVESKNCKRL